MMDLSAEVVTVLMLGGILLGVLTGYPLAGILGVLAFAVGYLIRGDAVFSLMYNRVFDFLTNYTLLAVPLFVFMGNVLGSSGITDKLYNALYLWLGGVRGGLAIATILIGTLLAACLGIITASVAMLAVVGLPAMLKRGYDKSLATGAVCSGGSLGILIPPSVMIIIYGPMASLSVGSLFMAAFMPGFLLSALYCSYVVVRCTVQPRLAPSIPVEERPKGTLIFKVWQLTSAVVPTLALILAVLGSIYFGVAAPTEAAGVGALAAVVLVAGNRRLNWRVLREAADDTTKVCGMLFFFIIMSVAFTGVFILAGAREVVGQFILAAPGGRWGAFLVIMIICFILGMFIDWIGIVLIMVPIITPIGQALGFDSIWFAMMIMVNLQMSFITPPFASAIFICRGTAAPELGVTTNDIIRGVIPYVALIVLALLLCAMFPQIILWLPSKMV